MGVDGGTTGRGLKLNTRSGYPTSQSEGGIDADFHRASFSRAWALDVIKRN
jgi:hypothetical protein